MVSHRINNQMLERVKNFTLINGSYNMPMDSVNTFDDLRSYVGSADLVIVKGYWSIGDGGGGIFYLDNGSSESDDGGITIQSSAGLPSRWKRIFGYIRWFGAKGNTLYKLNGEMSPGSYILTSPGDPFTQAGVTNGCSRHS